MTATSLSPWTFFRRGLFSGSAAFSLGLLAIVAVLTVPVARADLIVLDSGDNASRVVWRFDAATGGRLGVFGYTNEGLYRMTLGTPDEIFVTSDILGGDEIYRFNSAGQFIGSMAYGDQVQFVGALRGPDGCIYSAVTDGTVWRICRYDGPTPSVFIEHGSGGLTTPVAMLIRPDGNLYVADQAVGVLRFNATTGAFIDVFVPNGRGGLPAPTRMAFGPDNQLYISNSTTNAVYRYNGSSGAFVDTFVAAGSGGLNGATGLAFGPDGNLYVVSRNTSQVLRYHGATGAFLNVFAYDSGLRAPNDLLFSRPVGTESVWFDDALPAGAVPAGNNDTWNWVSNPAPFSGTLSHTTPFNAGGLREHSFSFASDRMSVGTGDTLFAYVRFDGNAWNANNGIMLSWCDDSGWEHRAYWGGIVFPYGVNGTASRRYMGRLPSDSGWQRLEIPASLIGLEGKAVHGMSFSVMNCGATWDRIGKVSPATSSGGGDTTPPTIAISAPSTGATVSGNVTVSFSAADNGSVPRVNIQIDGETLFSATVSGSGTAQWDTRRDANGSHVISAVATDTAGNHATASVTVVVNNPVSPSADTVWFDDAVPAGASTGASANDAWNWVSANPTPLFGTLAHQSTIAAGVHEHYFNFAQPLAIATDDVLFTYVYVDPANPPQEIMLSWSDGTSWEHRAFWGADLIGYGTYGTAGHYRIDSRVPTAGTWIRLQITARSVGLEGRSLQGMAFTTYDGRVTWDRTGKAPANSRADTQAPTLNMTNPVDGATVSGTITLSANASDDTGVAGLKFLIDGSDLTTISGPGPYTFSWNSATVSNGTHTLQAQASDGARNTTTVSLTLNVNNSSTTDTSPPSLTLSWPSSGSGTVTLSAEARDNVGVTSVVFLLDSATLGAGTGGPPYYTYSWDTRKATNGSHMLSAIASDAAGNQTRRDLTVDVNNDPTPPSVTITSPNQGSVVSGTITITAAAGDNRGVSSVDFKVDGTLIKTVYGNPFSTSWNTTTVSGGAHALSATAHDGSGNEATNTISVSVNNGGGGAETIWFDDAIPNGANSGGSGGDGWNWITANPAPTSGTQAHQSNLAAGLHEHYFDWAYWTPLSVGASDSLFAWVYLDPANPPREIMLSWHSDSWEHRAYWGANLIGYGTENTVSRQRIGDLPAAGMWTKLTVPASAVGFGSTALYGMSFSLFDGRATWDAAGKIANNTSDTTPPTVSITSPANGATVSGTITIAMSASDNVGVAHVDGTIDTSTSFESGNAPFEATWDTRGSANGSHRISVTAIDAAGNRSAAFTINVTVSNASGDTTPPTVTMTAPANNATLAGTAVTLSATASDNVGVTSVTFRVDNATLTTVTTAPYTTSWNTTTVTNGSHSLTALARDAAGNQQIAGVTVSVNNSSSPGAVIWMDSAVPAGSVTGSSGGDAWTWVTTNPAPFSGTRVHQSAIAAGTHDHFFVGASSPLAIFTGDVIFVYVYVDPANVPAEIMLSFNDGTWEHRAYWGSKILTYGQEGTASSRPMGALPPAGQWVQLQIPAAQVGLEGRSINGVSFTLVGGRATWDILGRVPR